MNNGLIRRASLMAVPNVRKVTEYDEAGYSISYNAVPVEVIENAPSVDAVEVVRCRDCKDYERGVCTKITYIMDGYYNGTFEMRDPDDFCSKGERKEVEA